MPGIIIPRKTVGELQKLVDDPDVAVTVELSDSKIRFTHRRRGADVETHRRDLSRLPARHPDGQRQGHAGRPPELRRRRRPCLDGFQRTRAARSRLSHSMTAR